MWQTEHLTTTRLIIAGFVAVVMFFIFRKAVGKTLAAVLAVVSALLIFGVVQGLNLQMGRLFE